MCSNNPKCPLNAQVIIQALIFLFSIRIRALLICHKGIMAHLVHLSICAIANDLDQLEDSCWILVETAAV